MGHGSESVSLISWPCQAYRRALVVNCAMWDHGVTCMSSERWRKAAASSGSDSRAGLDRPGSQPATDGVRDRNRRVGVCAIVNVPPRGRERCHHAHLDAYRVKDTHNTHPCPRRLPAAGAWAAFCISLPEGGIDSSLRSVRYMRYLCEVTVHSSVHKLAFDAAMPGAPRIVPTAGCNGCRYITCSFRRCCPRYRMFVSQRSSPYYRKCDCCSLYMEGDHASLPPPM